MTTVAIVLAIGLAFALFWLALVADEVRALRRALDDERKVRRASLQALARLALPNARPYGAPAARPSLRLVDQSIDYWPTGKEQA